MFAPEEVAIAAGGAGRGKNLTDADDGNGSGVCTNTSTSLAHCMPCRMPIFLWGATAAGNVQFPSETFCLTVLLLGAFLTRGPQTQTL